MRWMGVLLLLAACQPGGTAAPDATAAPDVRAQGLGLFVTWQSTPMLPGMLTDKLAVSDARFEVDRFEVVSDFEGGTSRLRYSLSWNASATPSQEAFPDARPGVYSQVTINLGGYSDHTYEIRGTWRDGNTARAFKIDDDTPLTITTGSFMTSLPAAGTAQISIEVDLRSAIGGIDFKKLKGGGGSFNGGVDNSGSGSGSDNGGDELELKTDDPQMPEFRQQLARAFRVTESH